MFEMLISLLQAKNYDKVIVAELHSQLTHGQL